MVLPRFVRPLLLCAALGAPFWLAAVVAGRAVAPASSACVAALLRLTAPLTTQPPVAAPVEPVLDSPIELSFEAATKGPRKAGKAPAKPSKPSALFVSGDTVLKLSRSAAQPRGAFVTESAEHPAGLRLTGVAALGIGLQDGDILIEALGMTPRAPEQVIGAIIEARAKQARFLSGTVWRAGQTFRITVEQPYLPLPA